MKEEAGHTIGLKVRLQIDFSSALERTVAALKTEGFGILTEIDVRETMKKKLDVDFPPYKILGACNPPLAHRALSAAPEVGLLLPCNVTVRQLDEDWVEIALLDPVMMMDVVANPELQAVATEALARLKRVQDILSKGSKN